jgi:negative regulator of replication initiation
MDNEVVQFMMTQIEKIGTQQEAILVKTAELSVEQKHLSHSVDEIKEDIANIQTVQIEHTNDIREIKESLKDSQNFKDFAKEFILGHPIISFMLLLMLVNIILTSIGLPIIQLAPIWASLSGGA